MLMVPGMRFSSNKLLADSGEKAVIRFLQGKGFRLVLQNFSVSCGEIDAIVNKGDLLLFVEVKTRSRPNFLEEGLVGPRKQQRIIAAAKIFLQRHNISTSSCSIRFDVAIVKMRYGQAPVDIDYIESAFLA
jgi:putative endonuclease